MDETTLLLVVATCVCAALLVVAVRLRDLDALGGAIAATTPIWIYAFGNLGWLSGICGACIIVVSIFRDAKKLGNEPSLGLQ